MAINEYDSMLSGDKPASGGNEYFDMVADDKAQQKQTLQGSMYVAAKQEPDRRAKVLELSKRTNLPADIVDRNFDEVSKKDTLAQTDYDAIIDKSPGLAKWLENPDNATIGKDDLDSLGKIENGVRLVRGKKKDEGDFLSDLGRSANTGWQGLNASTAHLAAAYGIADQRQVAEYVAQSNRRANELRDKTPTYAKEFQSAMGKEADEASKAFQAWQVVGSYKKLKEGYVLDALKQFASGGVSTVGESLDMIKTAVAGSDRLKGLAYTTVENLANSAPAILGGYAGMKGGALAGGAAGAVAAPVTGGASIPIGAAIGGTGGMVAGTFAGSSVSEVGAQINESLQKRGFDVTNPDDLMRAYTNPNLMAEVRGEAERKGITTAAVDAMFSAVAGKFFKGSKGASLSKRAAMGAADVGVQAVGETTSEFAGQVAREKGDVSKTNFGEAVQEGIISLGHSVGDTVVGASRRAAFSENPVQAAQEVASTTDQALKAQQDVQVLSEIGQAVKESKVGKRLPEKIRELVDATNDGEPSAVFFQADDWDNYWTSRGKSPAKAAETIMGDGGKAYQEAKETGQAIEVPLADYVEKVAPTEDYDGLLPHAKTAPDGMTYAQAQEHMASLPATMEEIANQATQPVAEQQLDESAAKVEENISGQLKAVGLDDRQAVVAERFFRTMGQRMGVDPMQLFEKYGLKINQGQPAASEVSEDTQVTGDVSPYGDVPSETPGYASGEQLFLEQSAAINNEIEALNNEEQTPEVQARLAELTAQRTDLTQKQTARTAPGGLFYQSGRNVDMSTEARKARAEALGFDTSKVYYHGTQANIKKFKPSKEGTFGPGVYLTTDPNAAGYYSGEEATGANIKPLYIRSEKPFSISKKFKISSDDAGLMAEVLGDEFMEEHLPKNRNAYGFWRSAVFALAEDIESSDNVSQQEAMEEARNRIVEAVKNAGYDSFHTSLDVVVVFDPKNIRSVNASFTDSDSANILHQGGPNDPRGQIRVGAGGVNIDILKNADPSTFFHEMGHFYLEVMGDTAQMANAPDQVRQDYQTILNWMGVQSRDQIKTEHHEQWARGFEAYIMEGKAPSATLRQAFARFKVWMVSVYRELKNLNVTLTKDVRDVMNRMLATDEEIAEVEGQTAPLFADPATFGMTGEKAARYIEAREGARQAAEQQVTQKLMDDYARQKKAWWKEQRAKIRTDVEASVNEMPVYRALSILQKAELPDGTKVDPIKLSREAVVQEHGAEMVDRLPKQVIAAKKKGGGVPPAVAAEILGFENGDTLVNQLAAAPKKQDIIEKMTDQRMAELYPDLIDNGRLPDEAVKAVHNDKRAQILRMELEHLASNDMPVLKDMIRKITRRPPSEKMVREQATKIVGSRRVGDIKPHLFRLAERRAAKEAGEALARGEFDLAFDHKQKELLNHELYRAAVEAQEEFDKSVEQFKKIARPDEKIAKNRDTNLVSAARAVLAQFGLGKADKPADSYLQQMKAYDPQAYETVSALVQSATETVANYKQVKFDDFIAMRDAVMALWDLAKTSHQYQVGGQALDRELVQQELEAQLGEISVPKARMGYEKAVSKWDKAQIKLLSAKAALTRVESWMEAVDVKRGGPFKKYLWSVISDATTQYRLQKQDTLKQYREILETIRGTITQKNIAAPELGYTFKDKTELLMALLHTGNESNLRKLLMGREWGAVDANGELYVGQWNKFVQRMQAEGVLTKNDYDFAQKVWDLMESMKPAAQRAHKQMYGYYFSEITANEIVTPFGTYRGGYVPAKIDPYATEDQAIREEREAFEKNNNSFQFPTTGRGFTKKRVDQYAAPLNLDMAVLGSHIDGVLRFSHIEPAVKQVARITQDKGFRGILAQLDPTAGKELLTPWLQRAAQQRVVMPSDNGVGKLLDSAARYLRKSVAMQIMVGNVTNATQQFTGLVVAMSKVKPRYIRNGLVSYISDIKGTTEAVMEKSEWMRSTQGATIMDTAQAIDKILVDPNAFQSAQAFAERHTYFLQTAAQNPVNTITWLGAYEQAIEQGLDEHQAVKEADSAVRLTQGSNNAEDVARFETGTATARLFTQFAGYFNMIANLNASEITKISRDVGLKKGAGRAFYIYLTAFALPAILSDIIVRALAGKGLDEDDDDEYLDDMLSIFFGSQLKTATALIPYIGQSINATTNKFNDKAFDDRISLSPVVSVIETLVGVPAEIYKSMQGEMANSKRVVKDVLMFIGVTSGLPVGPVGRPIGYVMDVESGKAEPSGPIDYTRGLVTGKPGKKP